MQCSMLRSCQIQSTPLVSAAWNDRLGISSWDYPIKMWGVLGKQGLGRFGIPVYHLPICHNFAIGCSRGPWLLTFSYWLAPSTMLAGCSGFGTMVIIPETGSVRSNDVFPWCLPSPSGDRPNFRPQNPSYSGHDGQSVIGHDVATVRSFDHIFDPTPKNHIFQLNDLTLNAPFTPACAPHVTSRRASRQKDPKAIVLQTAAGMSPRLASRKVGGSESPITVGLWW